MRFDAHADADYVGDLPPGTGNRQTQLPTHVDPSGTAPAACRNPRGSPRGWIAAARCGDPVNSRGRTTVYNASPQVFEPSAQIESLLATVAVKPGAAQGMRAMMQRESEFPNPLAAKLTGIALDPYGREYADQALDSWWSDEPRRQDTLSATSTSREVIIGSGFHAAVYAATRVLSGYPKPLVLEHLERISIRFQPTGAVRYLRPQKTTPSCRRPLCVRRALNLNILPGNSCRSEISLRR